MKKTLLALAVSALSANAFAVNLDTPAGTTTVFASEIVTPADIATGTALTTVSTAGFGLTTGFVRYDLGSGAKFSATPTLAGVASNISAGGAIGDTYVIFNTTAAVTSATVLTMSSKIKAADHSAIGVTYGIYQQAADAVAQTGNLAPKSGTLASFASALAVSAVTATPAPLEIDAIGSASKKFVGPSTSTNLVALAVGTSSAGAKTADGATAATPANVLNQATSSWTLNGTFAAAAATTLGNGQFTLAASKAAATQANLTTLISPAKFDVNGTTDIAETYISATFNPVASSAAYTVSPVTFSNITALKNNGSTAKAELNLKPGGAYSNYVRVSNTGSTATLFTMKVTNDAGTSVTINMSDVAGQTATPVAAGASTTQMTIQAIFDAAAAKGLTLTGEGKLRLAVTGATSSVSMQTYTTSKDGNSFSTF